LTVPIVSTARNDKERRKMRKLKTGKLPETLKKEPKVAMQRSVQEDQAMTQEAPSDPMEMLAQTVRVASQVVEEAVAAAEEAMDKALRLR
jgi:hypothetical protein